MLQVGMAYEIFSQPKFWLELLLVYACTFSLRYLERAARWLCYPNDNMILVRREAFISGGCRREGTQLLLRWHMRRAAASSLCRRNACGEGGAITGRAACGNAS